MLIFQGVGKMMGKDKGQSDTRKVGDVCVFFLFGGGGQWWGFISHLVVIVCYSYSLFAWCSYTVSCFVIGKMYSWIIKNPGCPTPLQELIPPGVNPPDVLGLMPPGLKPDKAHLYKTPGRKGCQKTRDMSIWGNMLCILVMFMQCSAPLPCL